MVENGGTVCRHLLYTPAQNVTVLYHSTFSDALESIFREGLKPAARDVHLWGPENQKRGRGGADVVLAVNAKALATEIWVAGNGVHLVAGCIAPRFLSLAMYE